MRGEAQSLHERLADFDIVSEPGSIAGKRRLFQYGLDLGEFDAAEGWELVQALAGSPISHPIGAYRDEMADGSAA